MRWKEVSSCCIRKVILHEYCFCRVCFSKILCITLQLFQQYWQQLLLNLCLFCVLFSQPSTYSHLVNYENVYIEISTQSTRRHQAQVVLKLTDTVTRVKVQSVPYEKVKGELSAGIGKCVFKDIFFY